MTLNTFQGHRAIFYKILLIWISTHRISAASLYSDHRCITSKPRLSSNIGDLDLISKVTRIFLEISTHRISAASLYSHHRCMSSGPRASSKIGDLELVTKVRGLFSKCHKNQAQREQGLWQLISSRCSQRGSYGNGFRLSVRASEL